MGSYKKWAFKIEESWYKEKVWEKFKVFKCIKMLFFF